MNNKKKLTKAQLVELMATLKQRFELNMARHENITWAEVNAKLQQSSDGAEKIQQKLWSLYQMETTGGEPDVVSHDTKNNEYLFVDCSAESPSGRRSVCYDRDGLESRKEHRPANSAVDMAEEMGIDILDEAAYKSLQQLGKFDTKTSSWIKTPKAIRELGGALFADYRYGQVFVYHNGAQSYYGARGFRGALYI